MNKRHTILVSDGDADVRTLLADVLDDEGYAVRSIHPITHEAIRCAQAGLIILELLPTTVDDTILLIGQIRRDEATRRVPILVSSTSTKLFETLAETLQRLNCGTLAKPFAIEQLLTVIAQALGQPLPPTDAGDRTAEQTCFPL